MNTTSGNTRRRKMERKRYLELCQKNMVDINSVKVIYDGMEYYPRALKIWFDFDGRTKNTAEMADCKAHSKLYCDVKDVYEKENDA